MSNIVFINPAPSKFWDSKMLNLLKGIKMGFMPKLSAMVFAALTPREKHNFVYVDEEIERLDYRIPADLVCLTAMTKESLRAYEIAGEFRKRGSKVIIGGIHTSVMTEEVALHCDSVVVGQGETIWPELLKDFEHGCLKPIYDAKDYPPVEHLVSPRLDVIKASQYLMLPIQATCGCPYDCEFCSVKFSTGLKYRVKPVEQVVNEFIEYEKINQRENFGLAKKGYYFVDDNLYVDREYVKKLMIALKPLHIQWEGEGSINLCSDHEVMQLMGEAGCRTFAIGFESIVQDSLTEANKPKINNVDKYREAISNLADHGIIPGGNFVVGFDHDDVTVFEKTMEFLRSTDIVFVITSLLTPYPGTRLHKRMIPRIFNNGNRFYDSWTSTFTPTKMTARELQLGWYWIGVQFTNFDFMWSQLKKYWKHGPWKNVKPLTFKERAALVFIAFVMNLSGMHHYGKFALRCAFYPKSTDFNQVMWNMRRSEMSRQAPAIINPADKYRNSGAIQ